MHDPVPMLCVAIGIWSVAGGLALDGTVICAELVTLPVPDPTLTVKEMVVLVPCATVTLLFVQVTVLPAVPEQFQPGVAPALKVSAEGSVSTIVTAPGPKSAEPLLPKVRVIVPVLLTTKVGGLCVLVRVRFG